MYGYQAFQLTVQSQLAFPELSVLNDVSLSQADVTIVFGQVDPLGLDAPIKKGLFFQAKKNVFWLHVPNIAYFLVEEGRKIIISPIPGVEEDSLRLFVLGSCFGALLMQRGFLLLHGSALQIGQHAVAFTGVSGAGKSTLSGMLLQRGYSILADDICAVSAQGTVLPSFPQIKLWADAAKQLTIETSTLRKIRANIEKYAIPLEQRFCARPLSLKVVYILNSHNTDEIKFNVLHGIEKFQSLHHQIYRRHYMKGLGHEGAHHMRCGKLAHHVSVARITRPQAGYQLEKLADQIESDLAGRGL